MQGRANAGARFRSPPWVRLPPQQRGGLLKRAPALARPCVNEYILKDITRMDTSVNNKPRVVRVTWQAENQQEPTTWYYHQRCYSKQRLPNMQLKRLPQETLSGEIFCDDCLGSLIQEGLYLYDLFKEPVPDYTWEEITAAAARWKAKNAQAQTHVKTAYLESIERVNEALRQGAEIMLWTDTLHLFATGEALPADARYQIQ